MPAALDSQLSRLLARAKSGAQLGLHRVAQAVASTQAILPGARFVHVAGTNGKGSTCAMVESIARRAGLRTGLYTSPHLCRFNERIRIDGEPIADEPFAAALEVALAPDREPLTVFEALTLAAFVAFREAKVDLAVLEVGLGGRLDATNVIGPPLCAAVTSIGLDHTRLLGGDLDRIAREKAAICKPGAPLVVGPLPPEAERAVVEVARQRGALRIVKVRYDDSLSVKLRPALAGAHQRVNAAIAAAIAHEVDRTITGFSRHIEAGIARAEWPGRIERIDKGGVEVLLDCAHNREGVAALCHYLQNELRALPEETSLLFGALDDKPFATMLDALAPLAARRHYCRAIEAVAGRNAAEPSLLASRWPGQAYGRPADALRAALGEAQRGKRVVVAGSIFLVGAVRAELLGLPRHPPVPL